LKMAFPKDKEGILVRKVGIMKVKFVDSMHKAKESFVMKK